MPNRLLLSPVATLTRFALVLATVGAIFLHMPAAPAAGLDAGVPAYTITDLGTLPAGSSSDAYAINDAGQVAGYADTGSGSQHAVLYSNGALTDLGALPGGSDSAATSINDAGQAAGWAFASDGSRQAVIFDNHGVSDLGTLPGGTNSAAWGINDGGQVVGWSDADPSGNGYAVLDGGGMTSLGVLGSAIGINGSGQVVGTAMLTGTGTQEHAFLYSGGAITDLGTLVGGSSSEGQGINASGEVVGYGATTGGGAHAFLYSAGHGLADLGTLGGQYSYGYGINDAGQAVGASIGADGVERAFLYENGAMADLNTLIPAGSGWLLREARAINDSGQIAGNGLIGGQTHAFLLTPVGMPADTATATPTDTATGTATDTLATSPTATAPASSTATATPTPGGMAACPAGNGLFTLYYGYIQNPASGDTTLQTIAGEHPNFVVVGQGLEGRGDIPAYLHQNGIAAIQYIPMDYGTSTTITATIDTAMQAGYDGVFFDQASADGSLYGWNRAQAAHVKGYGASKLVIMNPGAVPPDASMFDYADIVSVENAYDRPLPASWGIPSWRWLAVQGDPASAAATSAQDAENRLATFRGNGGFWYYSSAYAPSGATAISLPPWYTTFAAWVKGQGGPSCPGSPAPTSTTPAPTSTTPAPVPPTMTATTTPAPRTDTSTATATTPPADSPTPAGRGATLAVAPRSGAYPRSVAVSGANFGPTEPVTLSWDVTTASPLIVTTTAGGSFTVTVTVPLAPYGAHTLRAGGLTSGRSASASVTVKPRTSLLLPAGAAGASRRLDGEGFAAYETVSAYWGKPGGPLLGRATADATGSIMGATGITWTVPLSPAGAYRVYAVGQTSKAVADSAFTVRPSLSLSPAAGVPGSHVTVAGTGYGPHEMVRVAWDCATKTCRNAPALGAVVTDANGAFGGLDVTIPRTAPTGPHLLGATGASSGAFAAAYETTGARLVDVTAYGATGDGVTDNTAAFTRALAALRAARGGVLVIPPGVYPLNPGALSLSSNMAIAGVGATLTADTLGFEMLAISGTNVTVQGVTIDGARQPDGSALATRGISVYQGSRHVAILGSQVRGIGQAPAGTTGRDAALITATPIGIMIYGDVDTVTVDGVTVDDIRAVNKDLGYNSWVARGILITAGTDASGAPLPSVATNVTIQNSVFRAITPKDDGDAIVIQPSDGTLNPGQNARLRVLDNLFDDIAKRAVKIQVGGATIAGNVITNDFDGNNLFMASPGNPDRYGSDPNATEHYDVYAAISVYKSNVSIAHNTIAPLYGSFYRAVEIAGDPFVAAGTQNVTVSDNTVSMGAATDPSSGLSQNLIRLDTESGPVSGVTVAHNTLVTAPYGISLSAAARAAGPASAGNTFTNVQTPLVIYG